VNEPLDPFELLRALNPVDVAELDGERHSSQAHESLERIVSNRRRLRAWTPRRWWLWVARRRKVYVLALVPLSAVAVAGAWALTHGATKQLTVGCYARADLDARTLVVGATGASPVENCKTLWQRGDFGPASSPRLQACVLASGSVGVFPSADGQACERLKLASLTASTPPAAKRRGSVVTLKQALTERFLAKPCISKDEAISAIRAEIRKQRLNDWGVAVTTPFSAGRPCASLGFDEEHRVVRIVPMPRQR
jgi:hypothetical protein